MNGESSSNIEEYFTADVWTALGDYEKRRYENVMKNYECMKSSDIKDNIPEFIMNKFQRPVIKTSKINNEQTKNHEEPKVKFKHFGVLKPAVSKRMESKKGVYSDIPAVMDMEPSSSKMLTTTCGERLRKQKEWATNIQNSAQDILKELKDVFGGMEKFMGDMQFFDEDINLLEPGSFKDIMELLQENNHLYDEEINPSGLGSSRGIQQETRYPKRGISKISYQEEEESSEDEYLYCDICNKEHKGSCPIHGPMLLVCDKKIPKGYSDRAKQTLPHFLSIGVSSVPGADLGVWTEMPLVAGMVFGPYEGTIVKNNKDIKDSGYAWQVRKKWKPHHYVEAADKSSSNWMRYVNCANHEEWQNVVAFQYLGKIYYRTYKPILPYTEILVWYGDDYGTELGIQAKETKCLQPPREITGFQCDVCNGLFSSSDSLKRHLKKHPRLQNEKKQCCQECTYSSNRIENLRKHLLTHTGEKSHACPHCSNRFTQRCSLDRHILLHYGEKEHICSTCGKGFTQKGNLTMHERLHSGERPYRCLDCGKDFKHSTGLKRHSRLHTRQRPYPCPHCERRFPVKGTLTRHVTRKHTQVFPHSCSLCGKGFCVPSRLRDHVVKRHEATIKKEVSVYAKTLPVLHFWKFRLKY